MRTGSDQRRDRKRELTQARARTCYWLKVPSLRRSGFTLMELLVTISIIGILMSLLLPAIQQSREAARSMRCKANLKQIALAALNFESTYGYFPPGTDIQMLGPMVVLLPYLDQKAYYDNFSFDPNYTFWFQNPLNRPPTSGSPYDPTIPVPRPPNRYGAEGKIPVLLCPTSIDPDQIGDALLLETRGAPFVDFTPGPYSSNSNIFSGAPGSRTLTKTYYGPVGGDWYYNFANLGHDYRGIFRYSPGYTGQPPTGYTSAKGTRTGDVTDGLSNTLLFGETGYSTDGDGTTPGGGAFTTSMSIGTGHLFFTDGFNDYGNTFGSQHNGVIFFAFADGHVGGINFMQSIGSVGPGDPGDTNYSQELTLGPLFLNMLRLGGISDGEDDFHD